MIRVLAMVVCLLLPMVQDAGAAFPQNPNPWMHTSGANCGAGFPSPSLISACLSGGYSVIPGTCADLGSGTTYDSYACQAQNDADPIPFQFRVDRLIQLPPAPPNSTCTGGSCTCNAGYTEQGRTCVQGNQCPTAGTPIQGKVTGAGSCPSSLCVAGCTVNYDTCGSGVSNGTRTFTTVGVLTSGGSTCTGSGQTQSTPTIPEQPPAPCGLGTCPGTVNGVAVCLRCSQSEQVTKSTNTTVAPDGTSTSEEKKVTESLDDNGTITRNTTVTVSSTPPGGGTPTVGTTTKAEKETTPEFCKENPDARICKDGRFAGTCGAFTCEGDAATCAIALEVHRRNCQLFETATSLSSLGSAVAAGADPAAGTLPSKDAPSTVNVGLFNQTALFTGSCVQDIQITVFHNVVTIPLSSICPYLAMFGNVLVAVALLIGLRTTLTGIA